MDIKHQEETDKGAEKYLINIKKLHQQYLNHHVSKKPIKPKSDCRINEWALYQNNLATYNKLLSECTMRIEIINTNANQHTLSL